MSYVVTIPSQKHARRVLHRESCKALHHRTKRTYLINGNHYLLDSLRDVEQCSDCIKGYHFDLARAEAWQGHLIAAHKHLVEETAERERQGRMTAAKAVFHAQFEGLRLACQAAWGQPVTFGSYVWNGNLALKLSREDSGFSPADIYLTAFDGERVLKYEGINHSTGLISNPRDAYRLANVFSIIEGWVAPEPLSVPAGAPDFYGIR